VVGLIAGEGPLRPELEERVRATGAPVRLLGHLEPVGDLLEASDLLLVTSRREEMANVMLEALATGVPVISTPVGGARTALGAAPGEPPPGIVTPGFEPSAISGAVEALVAAPERRRTMADAARRRARERFDFDAMLDAWEALFSEVARP
jgi:glycosyltransferase involved in cell wall biosynthesis